MGGISRMVEKALEPKLQQINKDFQQKLQEIEDHAKSEVIERLNKFSDEMRSYKVSLTETITNDVIKKLKDEKVI